MVKIKMLGVLFLCHLSLSTQAAINNNQECYVFINSSVPEQLDLFVRFNEEYYLSSTLQRNTKIIFINISNQLMVNHYIVPVINDTQGIWVRKFKPQMLPTVFSIHRHKSLQRVISTTAEIRQCLQGK